MPDEENGRLTLLVTLTCTLRVKREFYPPEFTIKDICTMEEQQIASDFNIFKAVGQDHYVKVEVFK
jgi:hypothetical protein